MSWPVTLLERIVDAITRDDIPLALAIEIDSDIHRAWAIGGDGERLDLLVWTRMQSLLPLVNAFRQAEGEPSLEPRHLPSWCVHYIDSDALMARIIRSGPTAARRWASLLELGPPTLAEIVTAAATP